MSLLTPSSFDMQSLSNSIEGGTKWLVNKVKGLYFLFPYVAQTFIFSSPGYETCATFKISFFLTL